MRGLVYGTRKELDKAVEDFKTVLEHGEKHWAVYNDLAWIYFQKGDYKKTEEIARDGLEFNQGNAWLLTSLGVALLNQDKPPHLCDKCGGKKEEARKVLEGAAAAAALLAEADWQKAYPGNDPAWSQTGLEKMKETIEFNISLVQGERQ